MFRPAIIAAPLLALLGAGCGEPTQLYLAHNTVIGVDAAVNADRTSGNLTVGYDRQFLALAPKAVREEGDPMSRDAMAALVCSDLEVDGIFLTKYEERIATGAPAVKASAHIAKGSRDSIFDCREKTTQPEASGSQPTN